METMAGVGLPFSRFPFATEIQPPPSPRCSHSPREQPENSGEANSLWQLIHHRLTALLQCSAPRGLASRHPLPPYHCWQGG